VPVQAAEAHEPAQREPVQAREIQQVQAWAQVAVQGVALALVLA
jgi:hypothetical protein